MVYNFCALIHVVRIKSVFYARREDFKYHRLTVVESYLVGEFAIAKDKPWLLR